MPMADELEQWGNWLFRWRSYVPLIQLAVVLVAFLDFTYPRGSHTLDELWDFACLGLAVLGFAVRVYTVGHAPDGTSGRNTKAQVAATLNITGAYSVVRHPLYVGNFLIWLGISLFPRVWWCLVITTLATILFYERIIVAEERFLRDRFGSAYLAWARRTPAFVPDPRLWRRPSERFSWASVLRREYSGMFAIVFVFTAMELLGTVVVEREVYVEPFWCASFAVSLALFLILRARKKRYRLSRRHLQGQRG